MLFLSDMHYHKTYIIPVALSLVLFTGCKSTEQAKSNAPRQIDYAQYQTYSFGDAIIVSSENPAFSWPQFSDRVKREINFVLPSKGLERTAAKGELNIYFYAVAETGRNRPLLSYQIGWAAEPFISGGERFDRYPSNTLVLDFVDSNINQLVWRASTQLPYDDQDKLYRVLAERIHELIQQYPLLP